MRKKGDSSLEPEILHRNRTQRKGNSGKNKLTAALNNAEFYQNSKFHSALNIGLCYRVIVATIIMNVASVVYNARFPSIKPRAV